MIDPIWFLRNLIVALGEGIAFELGAGDLCLTSAGGVHVAGVGAQVLGHQATPSSPGCTWRCGGGGDGGKEVSGLAAIIASLTLRWSCIL